MFRSMKRTRQELPLEECEIILDRGSAGVLGTAGAEGYPYALPLSYVYLRESNSPASSTPEPDSCERVACSPELALDSSESGPNSPAPTAESLDYVASSPASAADSPERTTNSPAPKLGSIVFHCARTGHKVDALRANPRVSFCVIDQDEVIPEEFATYYKSVIAFGTAHFVEDAEDKRRLLTALGAKYSPGLDTEAQEEIDRFIKATCVVAIEIEHLSGKQAKGLLAP